MNCRLHPPSHESQAEEAMNSAQKNRAENIGETAATCSCAGTSLIFPLTIFAHASILLS
jgi:hypothetical protein